MDEPTAPSRERREQLLAILGDLVSRGGPQPLVALPVAPGKGSFPEGFRATRGGMVALLRRLAWHVGDKRAVVLSDERLGAPPTERKPETRIALTRVTDKELHVTLGFIGNDDVVGTAAHELGVAYAALHRPDTTDPYRAPTLPDITIEERDLERGSIATVYLGLGVLACNAAFQEYSRPGRFNGAYSPLEYDVLRAGYVPMCDLAYLIAVQAVLRGGLGPPLGLEPPQRDEVVAWMAVLRSQASELRGRLGISSDVSAGDARPLPEPFTDIDLADDPAPPRKTAFRWRTHRGGVGFVAGAVLGVGVATMIASQPAAPLIAIGGAGVGHLLGRRVRVARCSGCASVVDATATACAHCDAMLRGDIARLGDRLEAEERLADAKPE